jgi:hypothetical protein
MESIALERNIYIYIDVQFFMFCVVWFLFLCLFAPQSPFSCPSQQSGVDNPVFLFVKFSGKETSVHEGERSNTKEFR